MPHATRARSRLPLVLLSFVVLAVGGVAAHAAERPNFLFMYTDDQRWDTLGVVQREQGDKARFPWLQSPNLDRLAAEGVRFRNAFVVTSLCAPSRAAFLTGRYGHFNGVIDNHTPLAEHSITYASLLRAAGYRTGYIGKWHMGKQSGQRPGFDFSASFVGQGIYFNCPIEVNGVSTPSTGWVDDVSTEYARKFLTENKGRPFALVVGFKTCHGPFEPPERTAQTYADVEARPVPNLGLPPAYQALRAGGKRAAAGAKSKTNLGMFRGLRAVDENVGKLLAALDELGLAENTMVIYSSDNGYYLGEHSLGDKRSAYDESLRIPMLLRYPKLGRRGETIDQMVLNVDLAPTILDFAGLTVPAEMQGRSWRPLLTGDPSHVPWRDSFFYEYFLEGRFPNTPTVTGVRTDSAKLLRYPGHDAWTEMFDLRADPYETKNLLADPAHAPLRRELEADYDRQAKAVGYRVPDFADEKTLPPEPKPLNAWVLDFKFDKDSGDTVNDASGKENQGIARNAKLVETDDGHRARRFEGDGSISVKKSPTLIPNVIPWTIEATLVSDAPDGVILAHGGKSNGYALYLAGGRPTFTYKAQGTGRSVAGKREQIAGRRMVLRACVTANLSLQLWVDGDKVATADLPARIADEPHDILSIGADLGSPVLEKSPPAFRGTIERVRIFSGQAPAK